MASLVSNLIFCLICLTFVFGQTIRPSLLGINFTLIDLFLPLYASLNLFIHLRQKLEITNKSFGLFLIIAWLTLILNLVIFPQSPVRPFFYLIRLTSLLSLFIYPPQIPRKLFYFINICIFTNILFGLVQYFIWPDFTYFNALNWDPHLNRLVSTFFDPTFTALIYLIFIYQLLASALPAKIKYPLLLISYIALALTYSRSTLLALLATSFIYSLIIKKPKIFIIVFLIVLITIFSLPRREGEGSKLERTSSVFAKVENYKIAFNTISQSPIIGHGYNTLSRLTTQPLTSRAANGFDNSLLTIWATTGILGLFFFIKGFSLHLKHSSILINMTLFSILIHSFFANSLLYSWVLFYYIVLATIYRK